MYYNKSPQWQDETTTNLRTGNRWIYWVVSIWSGGWSHWRHSYSQLRRIIAWFRRLVGRHRGFVCLSRWIICGFLRRVVITWTTCWFIRWDGTSWWLIARFIVVVTSIRWGSATWTRWQSTFWPWTIRLQTNSILWYQLQLMKYYKYNYSMNYMIN